jgi:hypothetical protein
MSSYPSLPLQYGYPTHKTIIPTGYFTELPTSAVPTNYSYEFTLEQDSKVELLDEYIGFNGGWSKILHGGDIKYIKNTVISPLEGIKRRLRPKWTVKDDENQNAPFIDWTEQPVNVPYFYDRGGYWCIPILVDYEGDGTPTDPALMPALETARLEGTKRILKRNGKRNSEKYVKYLFDTFFFSSRVKEWTIPAVKCKNVKVLVTLANKYLISDEIESAISQNAIQDGETDYGAGKVSKATKFLKLDFTNFDIFSDQIINLGQVVAYYGRIQDRLGNDQIANLNGSNKSLDLPKYKEIVGLDLEQDSKNFYVNNLNLINTVRLHLNSNGYPDLFLSSSQTELTGINYNNIIFGFDDSYQVCYLNIIKQNEFLNLKANEADLFTKNIGEGGLLSARDGHLLYNLPNILNDETKTPQDNYADWVQKYVIPAPNDFPELDAASCVKSNLSKLREDALILKANASSLSSSYGILYSEINAPISQKIRPDEELKDYIKGNFGRLGKPITDYEYIQTIMQFLSELDWKKALTEGLACLLAQIPPEDVAALLSKAGSIAEFINQITDAALCNNVVNFISSLEIPVIPRYKPVNLDEAYQQIVKQAITSVIKFAIQASFNKLMDLLKDCQNQNALAPFGGLGLDAALDDLLNNPNQDNNPAVNNLYNGLGINGGNSGTNDPSSQAKKDALKGIIADIGCFLNTNELCALFINGTLTDSNYSLILNVIEKKYPILLDLLPNKNSLTELFAKLGILLNIVQICKDLTKMVEQPCIDCIDANQREKKALSEKNIDPDEIDKILKELDAKRKKRAADLLDLLENGPSPANIPPILCGFDKDGNPVQGLVNAANTDDNFKNQFAGILETALVDINTSFRKDFGSWAETICRATPTLSMDDAAKLSDPNVSDEEKKDLLASKGLAANKKEDDDGDPIYFPVDVDKLKESLSNQTYQIAPNILKNLTNENNFNIYGDKIVFAIDSSEEAKDFKNSLSGKLDEQVNSQINQAVNGFITSVSKDISTRLYPVFVEWGSAAISKISSGRFGDSNINFGKEFNSYFSDTFTTLETTAKIINDLAGAFTSFQIPGVPTIRQRADSYAKNIGPFDVGTLKLTDADRIVTIRRHEDKIEFYNGLGEILQPSQLEIVTEVIVNTGSILQPQKFDSTKSALEAFSKNILELQTKTSFTPPSAFSSDNTLVNLLGIFQDIILRAVQFNTQLQGFTAAYLKTIEQIQLLNLSFSNFTLDNKNKYFITGSEIYNKSDLSVFKYNINDNGPTTFQDAFLLDSSTYKIKDSNDILKFIEENNLLLNYNPSENIQEHTFNMYLKLKGITGSISYIDVKKEFFQVLRDKIRTSPLFYTNTDKTPNIFGFNIIPTQIKGGNNARCGIYPSSMDIDRIKSEAVENFVNSACNFKIPDAVRKAGELTPAEKSAVDTLVYTAIRVYLLDYYLKCVFQQSFSKFGQTKTKLMVNFLASYMESDMRSLNEAYFKKFLDASSDIYDRTNPQLAKLIEDEYQNEPEKFKKEKFKKLIESQINFVSRVFTVYGSIDDLKIDTGNFPKTKYAWHEYNSGNRLTVGDKKIFYPQTYNTLASIYDSFYEDMLSSNDNSQELKDIISILANVKKDSKEYKFITELCFDLKEYLSIFAIYQNLCIIANKNSDKSFNITKNKIKNYFITTTDAGGADYRSESYGNDSQQLSVQENLQNVDDDTLNFFIKALIKTPISILKGAAESGDQNIFISSLPYRIIKPILLAARVEDPNVYFASSFTTLGISLALSLTGVLMFNPTIIASSMGWAYLALVSQTWLDVQGTKSKNANSSNDDPPFRITPEDGERESEAICRELKRISNLRRNRFYGDYDEKLQYEEV